MAKITSNESAALEAVKTHRLNFSGLVASNPNYFGNLKGSEFKPVVSIANDEFYERVTCLGFNPATNILEAVVQVNQSTGYNGSLCQNGSFEYVRFFVDYGSGWEDAGLAAINVHDIRGADGLSQGCGEAAELCRFCATDTEIELVHISGVAKSACDPVLERDPDCQRSQTYTPVWGNTLDAQIQIRPRPLFLKEIAATVNEKVKQILPPQELEQALADPDSDSGSGAVIGLELAKLYAPQSAKKATATSNAVPSHRFGFAQLHQAMNAKAVDPNAIEAQHRGMEKCRAGLAIGPDQPGRSRCGCVLRATGMSRTGRRLRPGAAGCDVRDQAFLRVWRRTVHRRQHRIYCLLGGLGQYLRILPTWEPWVCRCTISPAFRPVAWCTPRCCQ